MKQCRRCASVQRQKMLRVETSRFTIGSILDLLRRSAFHDSVPQASCLSRLFLTALVCTFVSLMGFSPCYIDGHPLANTLMQSFLCAGLEMKRM